MVGHAHVGVPIWGSRRAPRDLRVFFVVTYFWKEGTILNSLQQKSARTTHYCGSYGHPGLLEGSFSRLNLVVAAGARCACSCGHAELTEPNRPGNGRVRAEIQP